MSDVQCSLKWPALFVQMNTIERRLRANGEKEETIAKYKDVDAYLKKLEKKLREGSTLDVGLKGHNKVSNLASQLSSKLTHPAPLERSKVTSTQQLRRLVNHNNYWSNINLKFSVMRFKNNDSEHYNKLNKLFYIVCLWNFVFHDCALPLSSSGVC